MRNYFTFGNLDSRDFGVYISGSGVYNAPKRVYTEVPVPGRNGAVLLDEGHYENIEVRYPAFIVRDFDENLANFRNALLAITGYTRLADSYHPDEYRMGYFSGSIEVDALPTNIAGRFDIIFTCKPQRYLVSGEEVTKFPPGKMASKNLITYPYYDSTGTYSGITWEDDGTGIITAKGKRTGTASMYLTDAQWQPMTLLPGQYILTGCPEGGGSSTYRICLEKYESSTYTVIGYDDGEGLTFTVDTKTSYRVQLQILSNNNVDVKFMPMIRHKYGSNYIPAIAIRATGTSYSVTYTNNGDGTVTTSGTASSASSYEIVRTFVGLTLPVGNYKFTCSPAGGSSTTYRAYLNKNGTRVATDYGTGADFEVTDETAVYSVQIGLNRNVVADGLVFAPAIRSATESDDTWERYCGEMQLLNPTVFPSKPLLYVLTAGTGTGTITINGETITIDGNQFRVGYIDSDIQDCYRDTENLNTFVTFQAGNFPEFIPGLNTIEFDSGISEVDVTPRWWRI